jgi:hypothetical protein
VLYFSLGALVPLLIACCFVLLGFMLLMIRLVGQAFARQG